jgi:hypothetical protein
VDKNGLDSGGMVSGGGIMGICKLTNNFQYPRNFKPKGQWVKTRRMKWGWCVPEIRQGNGYNTSWDWRIRTVWSYWFQIKLVIHVYSEMLGKLSNQSSISIILTDKNFPYPSYSHSFCSNNNRNISIERPRLTFYDETRSSKYRKILKNDFDIAE